MKKNNIHSSPELLMASFMMWDVSIIQTLL